MCISATLSLFLLVFSTRAALGQNGQLLFHSGFEAGSTLHQLIHEESRSPGIDITGIDTSVSGPNDWVENLERNKHFGRFRIYYGYGSGDTSSRIASIVADPLNPENKVLHYWYKGPVEGKMRKARMQSSYSGRKDLKEWYSKSRILLPHDLSAIAKHDGAIGTASVLNAHPPMWFTLAEFWSNLAGGKKTITNTFRITLAIRKDAGAGKKLRFGLTGEVWVNSMSTYQSVWDVECRDCTIPFGEWLQTETYFKEGDYKTGRFYWALTREDGTKIVVFDVHDYTHHPDDPSPNGMQDLSLFKLYTSPTLVDLIRENGGVTQIYWDDWEMWTSFPPDEQPAPTP